MIQITNEDNMELMARYPDNHFELAIVDPPYGVNIENSGTHFKKYEEKGWDNETPTKEYFNQLQRVSKNQIIWGGNYFLDYLGNTKCMIIWDKKIAEKMSFAMCEIAWTSLNKGLKYTVRLRLKMMQNPPTQKPVKLYEWLLINYAKQGDKILDTHLGSGSIAIACHNLKFDLTACELDKEYFEAATNRLKWHQKQQRLF